MAAKEKRTQSQLAPSEAAVSDVVGRLIEFWGFKRNMGRIWVQGERKDFYTAEVQLWRMISRVFNEREKSEIVMAIESFEEALSEVSKLRHSTDPKTRARAELQYERIKQLLELAKLGKRLMDTLLATAKIDAEPLVRFLLRQQAPSSSSDT